MTKLGRVLFVGLVFLCFMGGVSSTPTPVAYYEFDDTSCPLTDSANSNDLACNNFDGGELQNTGLVGDSVFFDNNDDYAGFTDVSNTPHSGSFTVGGFTFVSSDTGSTQTVFNAMKGSFEDTFIFYDSNGNQKFEFLLADSGSSSTSSLFSSS